MKLLAILVIFMSSFASSQSQAFDTDVDDTLCKERIVNEMLDREPYYKNWSHWLEPERRYRFVVTKNYAFRIWDVTTSAPDSDGDCTIEDITDNYSDYPF